MSCAVRARSDRGSFVMASVGAPIARAAASTAATSGAAPDCEMPMTAPRAKLGGVRYRVTSDGAASAVTMPARLSKRYFP